MLLPPENEDPDFGTPLGKLLEPGTPREIRSSGLAGLVGGAALLVPGVLPIKLAPALFTNGLRR